MSSSTSSQQAHNAGPTYLAFQRDGSKLYTGGADCLVRIWRMDREGEEPAVAHEADEGVTSITCSPETWLSASMDGNVRQYNLDEQEMTSLFTRTPGAAVRSVAFNPKGDSVAVASDDPTVKVINFKDPTQVTLLNGHSHPVRRVSWHPAGVLLSTSSSDGNIFVWDTSTGEIVKKIEGAISSVIDNESEEYSYDCSAVWHPSGERLYVPSKTHDIACYSRDEWKKETSLTDEDATGSITALCMSTNGQYLAAATESKDILIYSTLIKKVVVRNSSQSVVTCMAFSPSSSSNLLVWTCVDGTVVRFNGVIPEDFPAPNVKSSEKKSVSTAKPAEIDPIRDDFDAGAGMDYDDDWVIDDLGTGMKDAPFKEGRDKYTKEMVSVTKSQPTFQPGATPMRNGQRYLAFNSIGIIEAHDQEIYNVVNVDFHDRNSRKPYHFQDTNKYNMASMGERGILYACKSEGSHPGKIEYKPYATWASTSEWSFQFPAEEDPLVIAAGGYPLNRALRDVSAEDEDVEGNGVVVVASSKGYIRFFSGGGLQRYIWYMGDEIVTMVAGREWAFIVHREGGTTLDGCQNLSYSLISLDNFVVLQTGRLPLPKLRELRWIGISDEGAPLIYDSTGLLSLLDRYRQPTQARWIPLLDTNTLARKEGKDETYWPVTVSANAFMCIILKGREQFPGFPRPIMQELNIHLPLLEMERPESRLEEQLLREQIFTMGYRDTLEDRLHSTELARRELEIDKQLIQLIQAACKAGQLQKAVDGVLSLHHKASFDGASKVAGFYQLAGLQEKIERVKEAYLNHDWREEDREKRKRWFDHKKPIIAPEAAFGTSSRGRLGDLAQSNSGRTRKPLKLAEPTPNSKESNGYYESETFNEVWDADEVDDLSSNNKRKRSENDSSSSKLVPEEDPVPKRRLLANDESQVSIGAEGPSRPTSNPFLKKTVKNGQSSGSSGTDSARSLQKSDSFFDKMESAPGVQKNTKLPFGKSKQKSNGVIAGKQQTLFQLQKKQNSSQKTLSSQIDHENSKDANTSTPDSQEIQAETQIESSLLDTSQNQDPAPTESQVTVC